MLNLSNEGRTFLNKFGALALDEAGHEVLIGLTVLESGYFLRYQEEDDLQVIQVGSLQFYDLMQRHRIARQDASHRKPKSDLEKLPQVAGPSANALP